MIRFLFTLGLAACLLLAPHTARAEFALRDGDTVAFFGDSITAARGYPKLIENYTLLRFPERRIRFVNAGKGGDTAQSGLLRLERDVFDRGATVVTVALGVNDIGWGMKADETHKKAYLDGLAEIIARCQARGVRVFICSAAITAEAPERAETGFLQKMCDEGLAQAQTKGAGTIDVQRFMRAVQRRILEANAKESDPKNHTRLHADDGVHLNDLGQLAMGFAILKGLGAPADVSSATLDAASGQVTVAEGCRVTEVAREPGRLAFERLDDRLPLNLHPLWMLNGRFLPIGDEFNRYLLTLTNLPAGRYTLTAGGRPLGSWDERQLAAGVNLASATADPWAPGGPWDAQAHALKVLTDMRDEAVFARRGLEATLSAHSDFPRWQVRFTGIEEAIVGLQRDLAQPTPVQFEVRPETPAPVDPARIEPKEIRYGEAGGEPLWLDVYEPPASLPNGEIRAGVILVHGGGWCGGARKDVAAEARRQAAQGRVAFAVGYRLVNGPERLEHPDTPVKNRWPAALDDCQLAVRWIREHAADYRLDPARLGAIGFSAGGHLVSLLGTLDTRHAQDATPPLDRHGSRVTAVINVVGPADFLQPLASVNVFGVAPDPQAQAVILRVPVQWLVDDLLGSTDETLRRLASPQHHIDNRTVPFLNVHGAQDLLVPIEQGRGFHAALRAAGRDAELLEFPDEGHGFGKPENVQRFHQAIDTFWTKHLSPKKPPAE